MQRLYVAGRSSCGNVLRRWACAMTRLSKTVGRQGNWAAAVLPRAAGLLPVCRPLCLNCGAASCSAASVTCAHQVAISTDGDRGRGAGNSAAIIALEHLYRDVCACMPIQ